MVCIAVGGRNLPSVKGYVEVQFTEPVNDFWGIHEVATAPVAAAKIPEVCREAAQSPTPPAPVSAAPKSETVAKPAKMQPRNAPSLRYGVLLRSCVATTQKPKPNVVQLP